MPSLEVDDLLKETVNRARLMFSAATGSSTEYFPYHVCVRFSDRAGEVLAYVNFERPAPAEGVALADTPSMEFAATTLSGDSLGKGTGLDGWAQFLNSKGWLASWVQV